MFAFMLIDDDDHVLSAYDARHVRRVSELLRRYVWKSRLELRHDSSILCYVRESRQRASHRHVQYANDVKRYAVVNEHYDCEEDVQTR